MSDTKYNGWTNYATWRVNLEVFDGLDPYDYFSDDQVTMSEWLPSALEEYADQVIFECASVPAGLAMDYARAFMQDVNWHEIAEHLIQDYAEA